MTYYIIIYINMNNINSTEGSKNISNIKYVDQSDIDLDYLTELYDIMDKYKVNRVYHMSVKDKKFSEIHQSMIIIDVHDESFKMNILKFIKKYLPIVYFKIILQFRLFGFKYRLKKLLNNYDIETISTKSFNLCEGITITQGKLILRNIQIIFKSGIAYQIDKLNIEVH